MSYSTKGPTPSYGHILASGGQIVTPFNNIIFNSIVNNTPDITLLGTDITILTAGTYKIDFVVTTAINTQP